MHAARGQCDGAALPGCVDVPAAGDTLQLVLSGVLEREAAARDEVFHGLRDEHLRWLRKRRNARADRDRDATVLPVDELAFARVHASPDDHPQVADTVANVECTVDRAR